MKPERLTVSVEEAGAMLGISRGSAYEAAKRGDLPGVLKIGRRLVVSRARLLAALEASGEEGRRDA
jgi:excisionase family DNA binding protein